MTKMLSAIFAASVLGLAGAASAGEPVTLTNGQLDTVSAGVVLGAASPTLGITGAATNRIAGQTATFVGLGGASSNSGGVTPAITTTGPLSTNVSQLAGS